MHVDIVEANRIRAMWLTSIIHRVTATQGENHGGPVGEVFLRSREFIDIADMLGLHPNWLRDALVKRYLSGEKYNARGQVLRDFVSASNEGPTPARVSHMDARGITHTDTVTLRVSRLIREKLEAGRAATEISKTIALRKDLTKEGHHYPHHTPSLIILIIRFGDIELAKDLVAAHPLLHFKQKWPLTKMLAIRDIHRAQ